MFIRRPTLGSNWSNGDVFGLGEKALDAPVLNRALREISRPVDGKSIVGPAVVIGDTTFASPGLFHSFELAAQAAGKDLVRLARDEQSLARFADPLKRLPRHEGKIVFDAWYVADGQTIDVDDDDRFENAPLVSDVYRGREVSLDADPEVVDGGVLTLGFTSSLVAPVGHWVELGRTNVLASVARRFEMSKASRALQALTAPFRARSLDSNRLLGAMNEIGIGCDIHPTAWIETSVLGDNVEVGPGAVVRNCVIGDGVKIDAQAIAELSVVGKDARLQRRCLANMSLVYEKARIGGILQLGVAGEESALKMFGVGTDMRLDGPVRVTTPDGLVPVDISYQGVCIGHRAFVGSGVWIAPGRVIEAGRRVGRARDLFVL